MAVSETYDVVVAGGGINGASIFHSLAGAGYRTLLVDRDDFGSGTSQASAMLVWGGLLYLRDFELRTVLRLSAARDALIRQGGVVQPQVVRYLTERGGRSRAFVQSVLYSYWALGRFRRRRPRFERDFPERALFNPSRVGGALTYEEGRIATSDARFVLSCVLSGRNDRAVARNYCGLTGGSFEPRSQMWRLQLGGRCWTGEVQARMVINAAGGWTDDLNAVFKRASPWRHVLGTGVSICIPRDARHRDIVACDAEPGGSAMSLVPWGPVSVWGSTDTVNTRMGEAGRITGGDVAELLRLLNAHLASRTAVRDIVSVRCGVRALAVPAGLAPTGDIRRLSRRHRIHPNPVLPWVSVYGGKLSGCLALAADVKRQVERRIGRRPSAASPGSRTLPVTPLEESFPTLNQPVTPAAWSVQHELCCCLEDYLRRRTNIAQWVPRGGLGRRLEFIDRVREIARVIHGGDIAAAQLDLARYQAAIDEDWRLVDPDAVTQEERSLTWSH